MQTILKSRIALICVCLLLWVGCGESEDVTEPASLIGTWNLVTTNGKTLKADVQADNEDLEVRKATSKYVFSPTGTAFRKASITFWVKEEIHLGVWIEFTTFFEFTITAEGQYVVSEATLEFITSDRVNVEFSVSINTGGIPELEELQQELQQEFEQFAQEAEQEFKQQWELELETYTWKLDGDILTLSDDNTGVVEVYQKQ